MAFCEKAGSSKYQETQSYIIRMKLHLEFLWHRARDVSHLRRRSRQRTGVAEVWPTSTECGESSTGRKRLPVYQEKHSYIIEHQETLLAKRFDLLCHKDGSWTVTHLRR